MLFGTGLICFAPFEGKGAGTHVYDPARRNMPLLLPHELYPWMMDCGIWPRDASSASRTPQYWQHLRYVKSPVAEMSPGCDHVPLYLWGDGAQYTESGQSIMVLSCGLVMDDMRTNIFPLCLCREDPWMQPACLPYSIHAPISSDQLTISFRNKWLIKPLTRSWSMPLGSKIQVVNPPTCHACKVSSPA